MPARLLITDGTQQLPPRLIEQEVVRIGSSPRCDVRLERIPPHALTVFYREDQFFVINKSDLLLDLDGEPILPGETRRWDPGPRITVAPNTVLEIGLADDPTPSLSTGIDDPEEPFDEADAKARVRRCRRNYLMITAACIAILVAWTVGNHAPGSTVPIRPGREAEYENLITLINSSPTYTRYDFVPYFRNARAAEIQEDKDDAVTSYLVVLHELTDGRGNLKNPDPTLQRVVRYAENGLERLSP